MRIIIILTLILLFETSCKDYQKKEVVIDYSMKDSTINTNLNDTINTLKVAIAAMISPKETLIYYKHLLGFIGDKLNIKIKLIQRKTYQEINELIEKDKLDFAFICSGAYVDLSEKIPIDILAIPQTMGKSLYQAYVISNKSNYNVNSFADLQGKSFAFTDPMSNTGKLYALKKIMDLDKNINNFFSKTIFSHGHDYSIYLVNKGLIDGATVDGLIYEYIKSKNPEKLSNIKIIDKSEYFGIPPIVCKSSNISKLEKLRDLLLNMHKDSIGRKILANLHIDKFVPGFDSYYYKVREMRKQIKQ